LETSCETVYERSSIPGIIFIDRQQKASLN